MQSHESKETKSEELERINHLKQDISLQANFTHKVNLAQQQNEIPFLTSLEFHNSQEYALENIVIKITSDPLFLEEKEWRIDRVNAGSSFSPKSKDVSLSRKYLAECREAVRGTVRLSVEANGKELDKIEQSVLILPPDEWGGMDHLPELTAAFCRPNDPAVERVLKDAAIILKESGKGVNLDGYQKKDRNNVYMQISAIYNAITKLKLDYTNPPASFEYVGQKVRMPGRILESGLATCFDLTLFMASCLEQCGLNPLIIFTKGHSFVGCWLIEDDFSTSIISDPQAIRKRQQLGELTIIETTLLTQSPTPSLKTAIEVGQNNLEDEDSFECAVDIRRSRMKHIRPLMDKEPSLSTSHNTRLEDTSNYVQDTTSKIEEIDQIYKIDVSSETSESLTPSARIEQWKSRLLDLTKRNPLLNFKSTKKSLPIYSHNPAELEDKLAADQKLKLVSMPKLMGGNDPRSAELFEERYNKDSQKEYSKQALSKKDILIKLDEEEMDLRLVNLYRSAKHDLEEGGANTLFIAIGFLSWKESEHSEKAWKAPLILIPVVLERKSVQAGFKLIMRDDEPIFNPTLIEMLRADYQITLPQLEGELPTDHSGLDIPKILQTVRAAIRDIKGWEVTEEVVLSTFSFSKYLMWKDLQDNAELLKENSVVRHLIDTPQEPYRDQGEFPNVMLLDRKYHPAETFCPLSADAYQMAAIYAASEGKDFVLLGPPGTGKSQTITNMIVQLIAMDKTVLFVSEKMAALDVVYRRLRDVGLGNSCLELHSSKANKKDVLMQLGAAWNAAEQAAEDLWQKEANKLANLRDKLNEYPERLHYSYRNGLTPHKALGRIIADKNLPFVSLSWNTIDEHSEDELENIRDLTKRLSVRVGEAGVIKSHPFAAISKGEWSPIWQDTFQKAVYELISACESLEEQRNSLVESLSIPQTLLSNQQIHGLLLLSSQLLLLDNRPISFAFSSKGREVCNDLEKAIIHGKSWLEQNALLSQKYIDNGSQIDDAVLSEQWVLAESSWWLKAFSIRHSVLKALKKASLSGKAPESSSVKSDLAAIASMKMEAKALDVLSDAKSEIGKLWQGVATDWGAIADIVAWARKTSEALPQLAGGKMDILLQLRHKLKLLTSEGQDLLIENGAINQSLVNFTKEFGRYNKASDFLDSIVTVELKKDSNSGVLGAH